MKFFSAYNRPPSKAHCQCPFEIEDYIKDTTTGELVPCGKIPIYERIQSFYESTTLSSKLRRFSLGDSTALGNPGGSYGDFTQVPSDLRSILDARKKVYEDFNGLDANLRAIFNNDFDEFEKSVREGTAERRIYDYNKSKVATTGQTPGTGSAVDGGAQ